MLARTAQRVRQQRERHAERTPPRDGKRSKLVAQAATIYRGSLSSRLTAITGITYRWPGTSQTEQFRPNIYEPQAAQTCSDEIEVTLAQRPKIASGDGTAAAEWTVWLDFVGIPAASANPNARIVVSSPRSSRRASGIPLHRVLRKSLNSRELLFSDRCLGGAAIRDALFERLPVSCRRADAADAPFALARGPASAPSSARMRAEALNRCNRRRSLR